MSHRITETILGLYPKYTQMDERYNLILLWWTQIFALKFPILCYTLHAVLISQMEDNASIA